MKTKLVYLDDIEFVIPEKLQMPTWAIGNYPSCCGAGKGLGEKIVPETIWGLKISHCCYIHDKSWELAKPTWDDFHQTNDMFLRNMLTTIRARPSRVPLINIMRTYRATTYYSAVSLVGFRGFWALKKTQGYLINKEKKPGRKK